MSARDVADALEEAAKRLEGRSGNDIYQKAWRAAARVVRQLKHEKLTTAFEELQELTDAAKQISSSPSRPVTERLP